MFVWTFVLYTSIIRAFSAKVKSLGYFLSIEAIDSGASTAPSGALPLCLFLFLPYNEVEVIAADGDPDDPEGREQQHRLCG